MELQCGLCDHQYSQPRVLSCLHTYCLSCLETLVKKQDREGEVCCPVCQQRTLLPSSDPSTLPSDPIVGMLLEVKSVEAGAVTCTSCEENSSAVCRCLDCAAFLCSNCQGAHRFMKCFKSHRLVELEKLSIGDLASPVKLLTCTKHDGEALEFYCNTCDMLVCLKCTAIDHRMTSHQYVYINDAAAVMKERLLYLLENGRKRSEDVRVQLLHMEEKIDHVQVEKTRVKGEVDKVFHTLLTKLEDRQEEMRQDVETLYQRQQQFLNTQGKSLQYDEERLQAGTRFVEKLVTYGSTSDLLTCGKLVTSQFDLLFKQCTGNDMKSSGEVGVSVDYHTFSNLLNRIQIKIKTVPKIGVSSPVTMAACSRGAESRDAVVTSPPLKEQFSPSSSKSNVSEERTFGKGNDTASMDVTELHKVGSFGKRVEKSGDSPHIGCIAVGANGNIYVLDMYSWLVQVFDKEGKYRFKFGGRGQSPGQLQRPVELATSTKGYIAVRESTTDRIQIFSDTGQFIFKFWLHSVHKPRSMVIDRRGRFLVEDVGKGRFPHGVVIYNSDGKLLTKIQCTEISKLSVNRYSLAISAQNQLLVVDHRANCVQVYSEEGRHLRTIHPRCSRLDIRGIIMDQNKLILILNNRVDRDSWYIGGLVVMAKDGTVLDKFKFPEKVVTHVALTHEGCPLAVLLGSSDIHVYGSIHTK